MTTLRNIITKIKERLEYKYYSGYKRKYYTLLIRALKVWKMPDYIMNFQGAVQLAKYEIRDLNDRLKNKEAIIERLIERLVDEYAEKYSEKEAHREAYEFAYRDDDQWYRHLPNKFQTEKEADEIFDEDLDNYLTRDPIGDASNTEVMNWELSELKKGGLYEASY